MTPIEVARRLVELCRQGAYHTAHSELYAAEAVSIEPEGAPTPTVTGLEAITTKGKMFVESMEIHGSTVSDPLVAGPYFSVAMTLDATPRAGGPRMQMEEICLYKVQDGKIVSEQLFYPLMDCSQAPAAASGTETPAAAPEATAAEAAAPAPDAPAPDVAPAAAVAESPAAAPVQADVPATDSALTPDAVPAAETAAPEKEKASAEPVSD
jgi:hypothetical protein